jgi:hypothetical protein
MHPLIYKEEVALSSQKIHLNFPKEMKRCFVISAQKYSP